MTNLTGAFLLTQAMMSPMVKNRWGRIINITFGCGRDRASRAGELPLLPSKAGMIGLTKVSGAGAVEPVHYG